MHCIIRTGIRSSRSWDLGLHDDLDPALKSVLQFNPYEPQVPHHLPKLPHSQQFDPSQFVHSDFNLSKSYSAQNLAHPNLSSFDLAHNFHHIGLNSFEVVEDLIRVADCLDSNQLQLAQAILERLNPRLRSPVGKPLQRAAFTSKKLCKPS
jgi:hypothetical protein